MRKEDKVLWQASLTSESNRTLQSIMHQFKKDTEATEAIRGLLSRKKEFRTLVHQLKDPEGDVVMMDEYTTHFPECEAAYKNLKQRIADGSSRRTAILDMLRQNPRCNACIRVRNPDRLEHLKSFIELKGLFETICDPDLHLPEASVQIARELLEILQKLTPGKTVESYSDSLLFRQRLFDSKKSVVDMIDWLALREAREKGVVKIPVGYTVVVEFADDRGAPLAKYEYVVSERVVRTGKNAQKKIVYTLTDRGGKNLLKNKERLPDIQNRPKKLVGGLQRNSRFSGKLEFVRDTSSINTHSFFIFVVPPSLILTRDQYIKTVNSFAVEANRIDGKSFLEDSERVQTNRMTSLCEKLCKYASRSDCDEVDGCSVVSSFFGGTVCSPSGASDKKDHHSYEVATPNSLQKLKKALSEFVAECERNPYPQTLRVAAEIGNVLNI